MTPHHPPRSHWQFVILCILTLQASGAFADRDRQADVLMIALPATAYLLAWNQQDGQGAWALTRSLGLTAAGTLALNSVIDKNAPDGSGSDAFPSGHTAIAFSSAAFIQRRYGWRPGMPTYLVAACVGWLRVDSDDHDAADVIGGAALGMISSYLLTRPLGDRVRATAWVEGQSAGLQVQGRW